MPNAELLLTGATVIDGTGGEARPGCEVLLRGDRIAHVAPAGTTDVGDRRGLTVIDLGGHFLLPGLIDCHVHLTTLPTRSAYELVTEHPSARILRTIPVMRDLLGGGATTVRDLSGADAGMRQCVEEGTVVGPDLHLALRILSVTGGHGDWRSVSGVDLTGGSGGGQVVDGPDAFVRAVREVAREGGQWVKIAASGGVGSPRSHPDHGGLNPAELAAVVDEADRQGLVGVAAHAQGTRSVRDAVEAGVRSIEHGYGIDAATVDAMGQRGTWLVPTLTTLFKPVVPDPERPWMAERKRQLQERARENLSAALRAGVRVAVGTDSGVVPHGSTLRELGHLVDLGLSPDAALRAATSDAAELLGMADEIGSLLPGRRADLVALAVNPLLHPHDAPGSVRLVVARGRLVVPLQTSMFDPEPQSREEDYS